jgi:acyl-CoA synthetase (AMP-forming)/AMP-acid ligase II
MPFKSRTADVFIPNTDLVSFVLDQRADADHDKPIFIDALDITRAYSLRTLRECARSFAAGLQKHLNFCKGDVLAIFSANSIEYPVVVFGTFLAGGTVSLVNPAYKAGEVVHQLRDSKTKVFFTTLDLLATAEEACEDAGLLNDRILVAADDLDHPHSWQRVFAPSTELIQVQVSSTDLAFVQYSSGTTGLSKGVRLSHSNLIANLCQWDAAETYLSSKDSIISVLPFSHIYGLHTLVMGPIRRQMTSFVLPRYDPKRFLELVHTHGITASFIVPPIVKALLQADTVKYNLSSLKFLCSGAAPLSPSLANALCSSLGVSISQGFGLTETSPVLAYARFTGEPGMEYTGSVGRLLPNIELKIVDEQGEEVSLGEQGELLVRGPNVMQGYLNNDTANANAFTQEGFFKTGDLGYIGDDGQIFLVDRIKELIKYKGFQVAPVELENILIQHPRVMDVAVIGRDCQEEVTELPTAFVVLRPEASSFASLPSGWSDPDADNAQKDAENSLARELISFVGDKVAGYKKLRGGVVFCESIPRVPAGKILRRLLKASNYQAIL